MAHADFPKGLGTTEEEVIEGLGNGWLFKSGYSKNILNDMYAKDLSRKVKSAERQRAHKGYYISAQAPYGYKVDPASRNRLIVDEEAAAVVKEIYCLSLAGNSLSQISRILTA